MINPLYSLVTVVEARRPVSPWRDRHPPLCRALPVRYPPRLALPASPARLRASAIIAGGQVVSLSGQLGGEGGSVVSPVCVAGARLSKSGALGGLAGAQSLRPLSGAIQRGTSTRYRGRCEQCQGVSNILKRNEKR